jgi:hypothetical protein
MGAIQFSKSRQGPVQLIDLTGKRSFSLQMQANCDGTSRNPLILLAIGISFSAITMGNASTRSIEH